jgi:GT2 family glycosyltransferase
MPYQPKALCTEGVQPRPILDDITVVIPTLGRAILEEALAWIVAGSAWPGGLIVVDQSSSSQVRTWVESLQPLGIDARYVPSSQRGRSAGLNRGLEQVRTCFVTMTDDDCFVTTDWLHRMLKRLQQEPGAIVTGRVDLAGNEEVAFSVVTSRDFRRYERPQLKAHPFIGGNAGLAMDLVRRIGPFDEHPCLQSAEDNDYGYRALRQGIPIVYDPDIVLLHYHWRDASQRAARYADYARSQGGFYGTHMRWGNWIIWQQAARGLVRGPVRWLRGAIRSDQDMVARGRAGTLYMLLGIAAGLKHGKRGADPVDPTHTYTET